MTAAELLATVTATLAERGKQYETDPKAAGKERSMQSIVAAFQLLTGRTLSVREGWLFMVCLKMVRMQASPDKTDTYVDAIAYLALATECVEDATDLVECPTCRVTVARGTPHKHGEDTACRHDYRRIGSSMYVECDICGRKDVQ